MQFRLIDTHCHVHFQAYRDDYDSVIRDALEEGVGMITIGTQRDTSRRGVEVSAEYETGVWCSVGLHPNHLFPVHIDEDEHPFLTREEDFDYAYYRSLCASDKVVAIGECGLDYFRLPADRDEAMMKRKQEEVFRLHLDLADEMDKPVVCHIRDAHDETIAILKEYLSAGKLARRGVVHCFTSHADHARQYVELGFRVSFTGIITFPAKKSDPSLQERLWDAVRAVPLDMLLVETDAPYLTPDPHRGARNLPQYVEFVAQKVADLKGVSVDEVSRQTTANAVALFGLTA